MKIHIPIYELEWCIFMFDDSCNKVGISREVSSWPGPQQTRVQSQAKPDMVYYSHVPAA